MLYGRGLDLSVTIDGPALSDTVWLWTRAPNGEPVRTACFREGDRRFAQHLESVTEPLAFWFATGRGRSTRHQLSLLLQPQIDAAAWRVTPPTYTGLAATEGSLGSDGFQVLSGSRIQLTVRSNRPLQDGHLEVVNQDGATNDVHLGETTEPYAVAFTWLATDDADLLLRVRDIRGV